MLINTIHAIGRRIGRPKVEQVISWIDSLTPVSADITVDVVVSNPFPFDLREPEIELYLSVELATLQHIIARIDSDLPAKKTSTVRFHLHLDNDLLTSNCPGLHSAASVPYALNGVLTASPFHKSMMMPFSHQSLLPVLRMPTVTDTNLYLFRAGDSKGSVSAEVELHNPNSFSIDISELCFDLVSDLHAIRNLRPVPEDGPLPPFKSRWVALRGDLDSALALAIALDDRQASGLSATCHGELHTPFEMPVAGCDDAPREAPAPGESRPGHHQEK